MLKYPIFLLLVIAALVGLYWYGVPDRSAVPQPAAENVELYYYDPTKDTDAEGNILCSGKGLIPVERHLGRSLGNLEESIRLLLRGELTTAERAAGITTEFPLEGFELAATALENGTLTLTFEDPQNRTVGGACRVGILWAQIEATARQFPTVSKVRFQPEELFQP